MVTNDTYVKSFTLVNTLEEDRKYKQKVLVLQKLHMQIKDLH